MEYLDETTLNDFIDKAKAHTYVAKGEKSLAYRPGSHDLQFHDGAFAYLDIISWVEGKVYNKPMSKVIHEKYLVSKRRV